MGKKLYTYRPLEKLQIKNQAKVGEGTGNREKWLWVWSMVQLKSPICNTLLFKCVYQTTAKRWQTVADCLHFVCCRLSTVHLPFHSLIYCFIWPVYFSLHSSLFCWCSEGTIAIMLIALNKQVPLNILLFWGFDDNTK